MAEKNFSLKDIKLLADHYSRVGNPEALALFQVIQAYYSPRKKPDKRYPIDPFEVLKGLKGTQRDSKGLKRSGGKPDMVEFS